jgi:hypothetical protein
VTKKEPLAQDGSYRDLVLLAAQNQMTPEVAAAIERYVANKNRSIQELQDELKDARELITLFSGGSAKCRAYLKKWKVE